MSLQNSIPFINANSIQNLNISHLNKGFCTLIITTKENKGVFKLIKND